MTSIDEILHSFLDSKIAEIKSDPSILDQIFEERPAERIEQIKQWLSSIAIRTVYHHPRDASDLPCYAIVLEDAPENEQSIGSIGDSYDEFLISRMDDGWIGSDSDIHFTKVTDPITREPSPLTYLPTDVEQWYNRIVTKEGMVSCHLTGAKTAGSVGKGVWIDFTHSVLSTINLSDVANITFQILSSNRTGTFLEFGFGEKAHREQTFSFPITVKNLWERIVISIAGVANRDKDGIRYMSFRIIDSSDEIDVYISSLKGEASTLGETEEVYFDSRYRIESWSNNADLTLVMFDIAKWNLLKYRSYMESSLGLYRARLDGGDIMPQPEWYPEFVYVRGLGFNCSTVEVIPTGDAQVTKVRVDKIDWGH